MKRITSIIKYVLLLVCAISVIPILTNGADGVDFMLSWAAVLLGLTIVTTLILAAFNVAKNPKGASRSLIGLGIMVVIVGISWALSSAEPVITPVDYFTNRFELTVTDTVLYTAYIIFGLTIIVSIIGEIRNSFK